MMALTAPQDLGCNPRDLRCFQTSNHHRKLFAQGLIGSIYNFFIWLLNLIDIFNIIPDPPTPPPSPNPTQAPSTAPTQAPSSTQAPSVSPAPSELFPPINPDPPRCNWVEDVFNSCLKTVEKCSDCLRDIDLEVLPDSIFDFFTTCDALKDEACSNLVTKWNLCRCAVCKAEAEDNYGCLIEDHTYYECSDNLSCFPYDLTLPPTAVPIDPPTEVPIEPPTAVCQFYNPNGTCADCFSPFNTVNVKDKGTIFINQLQIGDLVSIKEKGEFSRVYSFGHLDPKSKTNYLQIFAEGLPQPLEISPNHLLYVSGKLTPAFQVKKGDMLDSRSKVSQINSIQRHGKYAPLTESGTIRISGVDVSNYVYLSPSLPSKLAPVLNVVPYSFHHAISHGWTAPRRWACALDFGICKEETYKDGYASWLYSTLQFSSKLGATPTQVQIGFALVAAPCLLALHSPLFVVTLVFCSMFHRYNNTRIVNKTTKIRVSSSCGRKC